MSGMSFTSSRAVARRTVSHDEASGVPLRGVLRVAGTSTTRALTIQDLRRRPVGFASTREARPPAIAAMPSSYVAETSRDIREKQRATKARRTPEGNAGVDLGRTT